MIQIQYDSLSRNTAMLRESHTPYHHMDTLSNVAYKGIICHLDNHNIYIYIHTLDLYVAYTVCIPSGNQTWQWKAPHL